MKTTSMTALVGPCDRQGIFGTWSERALFLFIECGSEATDLRKGVTVLVVRGMTEGLGRLRATARCGTVYNAWRASASRFFSVYLEAMTGVYSGSRALSPVSVAAVAAWTALRKCFS